MGVTDHIVRRVWKLCDVLRDDGITYHQYVNELTYLLFLKMASEAEVGHLLPEGWRWEDLVRRRDDPEGQYEFYLKLLVELGTEGEGRVREIFAHPTSLLHHSSSLNTLVEKIDGIDWHEVGREQLGDIYEGLLQKNASEKKSGAGQYFTPRPLIDSIVAVLKPRPGEVVSDPAAGTCGFLVAANDYANKQGRRRGKPSNGARSGRFFGVELVKDTHRLALMNAILHDLPGDIVHGDSLTDPRISLPASDVILTNPPFGNKQKTGRPTRTDLPFPTSNKQFAFLQIVYQSLKPNGRAAVIVPDNVLFEDAMGAKVRTDLMNKCNLHTILRLPCGIFYAPGVKTNVLFFTRGASDQESTKEVWVYDLRSNMPTFGRRNPLSRDHFTDFEAAYGDDPNGASERSDGGAGGRFRCFSREEIRGRGDSLDIQWRDDSQSQDGDWSDPEELAGLITERLTSAIEEIEAISSAIEGGGDG